MVGTDTDISARKAAEERQLRAERQTQQAQKLASLGVLAGGIAHDFNNMLVAILGGTDLALQALPEETPTREALEEVRTAAGRAAELVRQIHAYSGQSSFARAKVDLSALVAQMEGELRAAVARNIRLRFELGAELPAVEADETQIKQVVNALVHNASEALDGRSGDIVVSTGRFERGAEGAATLSAGDHVVLAVADDGCGIDEDVRSRMFDPFFSTKKQGQGLGLAATLGIVRSHGGEVLVDSEVDRGTTMRVVLPVAESPAPQETPPSGETSEPWSGSGTVLVVDDDAAVRTIAERMLRLIGFEVVTAADGAAGVETFRRRQEEIVLTLLDMNMPGIDGAETFRRLRELQPTARVLFSSGDSERASAGVAAGDPNAHFIHKPYRIAELRATLESALAG
jgi:nitrogen-specific signal transduction histidine kinase/CheY-like chemotaxis protein